jgi:hypothetical protein
MNAGYASRMSSIRSVDKELRCVVLQGAAARSAAPRHRIDGAPG